MGFWKDVAELRAATQAKVKAGRGKRSLIEATQELAIKADTVQAEPKVKPGPAALEAMVKSAPPGTVKLTAQEYRRIMGLDKD